MMQIKKVLLEELGFTSECYGLHLSGINDKIKEIQELELLNEVYLHVTPDLILMHISGIDKRSTFRSKLFKDIDKMLIGSFVDENGMDISYVKGSENADLLKRNFGKMLLDLYIQNMMDEGMNPRQIREILLKNSSANQN